MAKKTREPARLGHADYCKWFEQMIGFKEDRIADGTWPTHLNANFQALFNELWDAWDTYDRLKNELKGTTYKAYDDASKPVYDRLVSLRELIPTLFDGDDAVLGEFGMARKVPRDKEDLFTMASGCLEHWDDITDPDVPPEYAPVADMFAEFQDEYDTFQAAYTAYIAKTRDVEEAQNLLLEKRELCHHKERLIFHWFKGLHKDGEAEWWTATLWGRTGGGSGGGEEPGPSSWEDAPTNFVLKEGVAGSALLQADVHADADGCAVFMAETELGVAEPPMRPGEPLEPLITPIEPGKFSYNLNITPNRRVWFWICHVKDGAWGAIAGPEWIEIEK